MKIIRITAYIFLVSVLGCQKDHEPKALVAIKTVSVYKTYEGDALQEVYKLSPGDQCAVGREEIAKMYGYLEVVCPGKGYGWVVKGSDYIIYGRDTANMVVK